MISNLLMPALENSPKKLSAENHKKSVVFFQLQYNFF